MVGGATKPGTLEKKRLGALPGVSVCFSWDLLEKKREKNPKKEKRGGGDKKGPKIAAASTNRKKKIRRAKEKYTGTVTHIKMVAKRIQKGPRVSCSRMHQGGALLKGPGRKNKDMAERWTKVRKSLWSKGIKQKKQKNNRYRVYPFEGSPKRARRGNTGALTSASLKKAGGREGLQMRVSI